MTYDPRINVCWGDNFFYDMVFILILLSVCLGTFPIMFVLYCESEQITITYRENSEVQPNMHSF